MLKLRILTPAVVLLALWHPAPAAASLTSFQTYTGHIGLSTDGFGSTSQSGTISAGVPAGATVLAAYLYTSTFQNQTFAGVGGTLAGTAVTYTNLGDSGTALHLIAGRADVTSIVAPIINAGCPTAGTDGATGAALTICDFTVTETENHQDGEALVVVYSLASLPTATVGIVDGFSVSTGDTTTLNFTTPLDPSVSGFFAEMRLGIGFSSSTEASSVIANGTKITEQAGNFDDGLNFANGSLITMGGFNDPFSGLLPTYANDHERYNLVPRITLGDQKLTVNTMNDTGDDNIFLATYYVYGEATVNGPAGPGGGPAPVPEPGTLSLIGLALSGLGAKRRFFRR